MVLIDTSYWIDHLHGQDPRIQVLLDHRRVVMHPFVLGELALGNLKSREIVLNLLRKLPQAEVAQPREVLELVDRYALFGRGIGYVDVALVASVRLTPGATLMTRDRRLHEVAMELKLAFGDSKG